jgi:hypothetical protein
MSAMKPRRFMWHTSAFLRAFLRAFLPPAPARAQESIYPNESIYPMIGLAPSGGQAFGHQAFGHQALGQTAIVLNRASSSTRAQGILQPL